MKISRKAEYAVRAVLDLAMQTDASSQAAEIARRTQVPEKYLDAILLELRRAGLLASKRGRDGGHWLVRDPSHLTLKAILIAIDGAASIAHRRQLEPETPAQACVHGLWSAISEAVERITNQVTLEDLRRQASEKLVDYSI